MKDFLVAISVILSLVYGVTSFVLFAGGVDESDNPYKRCNQPKLRIEKFFPTYRLGCYMGQEEMSKE